MSYTVVIPARYASSRLPAKVLADIAGKPMIQHVWERACASEANRVIIATDDMRILSVCQLFGAEAVMTSPSHPSGTDRLAEVAAAHGMADEEIVVNVQGDEPLIPAAVIDQVAVNLAARDDASIATLCEPIGDVRTLLDENAVKVVADDAGTALLFSRACIPWPRGHDFSTGGMPDGNWFRHLGIYAYRVGFLHRYTTWPPAILETTESLEQLRAMAHGERIHVEAAMETVPGGIDTAEDLERVRELLQVP
ncbi:MAG: 3-deoxy-manno-octulosonate cytidylyltransferase [Pseudomonadota bacterium]